MLDPLKVPPAPIPDHHHHGDGHNGGTNLQRLEEVEDNKEGDREQEDTRRHKHGILRPLRSNSHETHGLSSTHGSSQVIAPLLPVHAHIQLCVIV